MSDTDDKIPLVQPAAWPWRLPIIRHIRALYLSYRIAAWQSMWASVGFVSSDRDARVLRQIWRGIV
jgi:hypothetical protein